MKRRRGEREPHPDPGKELELKRILDLRASIARRETLIVQYRAEIDNLHGEARMDDGDEDGGVKRIGAYFAQAENLHGKILEVEASIPATHEQIAVLTARLDPSDLAFL